MKVKSEEAYNMEIDIHNKEKHAIQLEEEDALRLEDREFIS